MKETDFEKMIFELRVRSEDIANVTAKLANASAIVFDAMNDVNWAGFYLMENGRLALGPFQGKPAVVYIEIGNGVCGSAVAKQQTICVEDVHACENHIACDAASNSEIVVPLYKNGEIFGVLDIDSPVKGRFGEDERVGLERFCRELEGYI